jgi:hypothetical protein
MHKYKIIAAGVAAGLLIALAGVAATQGSSGAASNRLAHNSAKRQSATARTAGTMRSTGAPSSATAATTRTVNWQVALTRATAYPTVASSAQYQSQPGQRELQIEVERLAQLAGQSVTFYANSVKFGVGMVSTLGTVQIDRNTELGQSVPSIVHGSIVAARTRTGVLIVSGQF